MFVCTCACMGLVVVESGMLCVGQEGRGPLVEAMPWSTMGDGGGVATLTW